MTQLNGGEVLARALVANEIDIVFGIPGVQLDPFFAGLHDVREHIQIIHARHEQGLALMAFGYAHVSGKMSVVTVVPGPGFLNAATSLLTAHACNTPLLCLAGQSEQQFIGAGFGVLHELDNQIGIARSFTKWAHRTEDTETLLSDLAEAITVVHTNRPRPVYLELPSDILRMPVSASQPVKADRQLRLPAVDSQLVHDTARQLAEAEFPLIMAGGGATAAGAAIRQLAELLGAPVGMSENGLGTVDCRHQLAFSQLGAHKCWARADVVLALGTRLFAPVFNWGFDDEFTIIKVDIDVDELSRLPAPVSGIEADVGEFVDALSKVLPQYLSTRVDRSIQLQEIKQACREDLAAMSLPGAILRSIRRALGDEGIMVCDVTQINHHALDMFPVHQPHTYISAGYQGTLGFGLCTALGAKLAAPDQPVICLTGDGGFMYAAQELATAVQFNIPILTIVLNDGAYKNVEAILNNSYQGRAIATTLENPDFVKFADSFGVPARRVSTVDELEAAMQELLALNKPALIDYQFGEIPSAFWLRFLPQVRKHKPKNDFALVNTD